MNRLISILVIALAMSGCASDGAIPSSNSATPAGEAGKADNANSERARSHLREGALLEGPLAVGTTTVEHAGDPPFLVFEIEAQRADRINVEATSPDVGDPVLWLLTPDYEVLAKNDDAWSYSTDAELHYRAPQAGTYLVAIADVFRDASTFEITLEGPTSPDPGDLDAFLALSDDDKMETLYDGHQYSEELDLEQGFTRVSPFVIRDELEGDTQRAMYDAYFTLRDQARDVGGTTPEVSAIIRGGLIYGFEMATIENNEDTEWWYTRVFDANGEMIGEHGELGW